MSQSYEIMPYRKEFKQQIGKLQTPLASVKPSVSQRYFEWKYEQNPYSREPVVYLAFHGGELVGMRGFYGAKWEFGRPREACRVLVADDFAILPGHRNRGLATRIMNAAFEDLARRSECYVFNLSGGPVTIVTSLAMGWKSAGPLEATGRPMEGRRTDFPKTWKRVPLLARVARKPAWGPSDGSQLFAHFDRAARHQVPEVVLEREPRLAAMAQFVERLGHDGRIRHVRDEEFFAWRFRNPLCSYRFVYAGPARLEGYLVLRCPVPGASERRQVKIVDLEGASPDIRQALFEAALEAVGPAELFAWATTLPHDIRERLAANRFRPADLEKRAHGSPTVLVRPVTLPGSQEWLLGDRSLTTLADWDLRMLYTMAG